MTFNNSSVTASNKWINNRRFPQVLKESSALKVVFPLPLQSWFESLVSSSKDFNDFKQQQNDLNNKLYNLNRFRFYYLYNDHFNGINYSPTCQSSSPSFSTDRIIQIAEKQQKTSLKQTTSLEWFNQNVITQQESFCVHINNFIQKSIFLSVSLSSCSCHAKLSADL